MLRKFAKKRVLVALSVVVALAFAGIAVAYFTSSGSGPGSASVGKSTSFKVDVTNPAAALVPGGAAQDIGITVTNPAGSGSQNLSAVSVVVDPNWSSGTTGYPDEAACTAADFTVTQPVVKATDMTDGQVLPITGAKIAMNDDASAPQDNCQGVTVPLIASAR